MLRFVYRHKQVEAKFVNVESPELEPTVTVQITLPQSLARKFVGFAESYVIGPDRGLRGVINEISDALKEGVGHGNEQIVRHDRDGLPLGRVWFDE